MSVSSVSLNSDANVRYQRLAAEYSKLRSQAKVLREGVLSERAKVDTLTNEVKSKEAIIRKIRTENESLLFRNEQLVRRVESLQADIENNSESGMKSSRSSKKLKTQKEDINQIQSMHLKIELLEGELRDKLKQNEDLVIQLAENERIYSEETAELSEKFARQIRRLEAELEEMRKQKLIHALEIKKEQVPTVADNENNVHRNPSPAPNSEDILPDIGTPTPPDSIEEANRMLATSIKVIFDTFHTTFNLLHQRTDVYPFDASMESIPVELQKLSLGYSNCSKLFCDTSQLISELLEREVFEYEKDMPRIIANIESISRHCSTKLLGLSKNMLLEENKVNWCTPPLETLNNEWSKNLESLFSQFSNFSAGLKKTNGDLEEIIEEIGKIAQICTDLSNTFSRRWLFESRLPTTTRRMKCIGVALDKALQQLVVEMGKMNARAQRLCKMMISREEQEEEEEIIVVENGESSKVDDTNSGENFLSEGDGPSNSERDNQKTVQSIFCSNLPECDSEKNKEMKIMKAELEVLREKAQELQIERDKLNINLSLLKRKSELANGNQRIELSDFDHFREIRKEQMFDLLKRVEESECASRFYKRECEMLVMLQLACEEERRKVESSLESITREKNVVEDELESVRRGYDAQIIELSEHIATLMDQKEGGEESKEASTVQKTKGGLKSFFKS